MARRGLRFLIATLVILSVLLVFVNKSKWMGNDKPKKEEVTMLEKGSATGSLKSYQKVSGTLNIQHWQTQRGTNVYFVPVKTLPIVDIDIIVDAGAVRDKKGGGAYLTSQLLSEGGEGLTPDQVAENFDKVGAQFHAQTQRDSTSISLRSLSDKAQFIPALQNLATILAQPSFPETGLKREQQNTISALKQQAQKPNQVASRAFYKALYGNQPYANWVLGDEASIASLTQEDLKAFHRQYYVPQNMVIAIVGDLTIEEADKIAITLTEHLPEGKKAEPLPPVPNLEEKSIQKIPFPSSQTHILMGMPGIKQTDPDYYPLYVGNHILGGNGMVTRIFDVIRNQHGLAYSAYSYFMPMKERGPFVLGCQTRTAQADKAQELMATLLKEFVEKGPTEAELNAAKENLLGGYTLQFDSNAAICREIASLGFYQLPLDYYNHFKTAVEKVTIEDIKLAFQKKIANQQMAVVMVGETQTPPKKG